MLEKNKKTVQFPAAEILLSVAIKEYENELHRKRDLETRAGIFITLLVAMFTFFISNIDFIKLIEFSQLTNVEIMLVITLNVITVFTWSASMFYFIQVLTIYQYERLDLDEVNQEHASYGEDVLSLSMAKAYKSVIKINQDINNSKVKKYIKGIYFLIPFVITTLIMYVLSVII